MTNVLILMTALVPTTGHADLIRFACNLPDSCVTVIVNSRKFEPVSGDTRIQALREHFKNQNNLNFILDEDDLAPQNPSDHSDFWNWWVEKIKKITNSSFDKLVASELYGKELAYHLNADFIPFDINREINPIKGDLVRKNIETHWKEIIPEFRESLQYKVTMFGQESVGKTTITKILSDKMNCVSLFEYARPYLESTSIEITEKSMRNIHHGQYSLQKTAYENSKTPVILQDTDLFSTIGYYLISNMEFSENLVNDALETASDLYVVLPDDIPFEEDQLRYGGDQRESSYNFWVDLMTKYGLHERLLFVPFGLSLEEKIEFIESAIQEKKNKKFYEIASFVRD